METALVVVPGLLIVVSSRVTEHSLKGVRVSVDVACGLSSFGSQVLYKGSIVVAHELSCSVACGSLPNQGLNP